MKNSEDDIDNFDYADEAAFKERFRKVRSAHLPETIKNLRNLRLRDCKSRITIYLDADIVAKFREKGEKEKVGYQTLINAALRNVIDGMDSETAKEQIEERLLNNEEFLSRLREKLVA